MERCTLEKNGFVGLYLPGTKAPEKVIIAAGGASCDEKTSVSMCRFLRNACPSDEAVPRMMKRLEENHYQYRYEAHIYDKASHALTDGLDEMTGYAKWALNHMLPVEKKYPKECEEARQDSFKRIIDFIDEWKIEE